MMKSVNILAITLLKLLIFDDISVAASYSAEQVPIFYYFQWNTQRQACIYGMTEGLELKLLHDHYLSLEEMNDILPHEVKPVSQGSSVAGGSIVLGWLGFWMTHVIPHRAVKRAGIFRDFDFAKSETKLKAQELASVIAKIIEARRKFERIPEMNARLVAHSGGEQAKATSFEAAIVKLMKQGYKRGVFTLKEFFVFLPQDHQMQFKNLMVSYIQTWYQEFMDKDLDAQQAKVLFDRELIRWQDFKKSSQRQWIDQEFTPRKAISDSFYRSLIDFFESDFIEMEDLVIFIKNQGEGTLIDVLNKKLKYLIHMVEKNPTDTRNMGDLRRFMDSLIRDARVIRLSNTARYLGIPDDFSSLSIDEREKLIMRWLEDQEDRILLDLAKKLVHKKQKFMEIKLFPGNFRETAERPGEYFNYFSSIAEKIADLKTPVMRNWARRYLHKDGRLRFFSHNQYGYKLVPMPMETLIKKIPRPLCQWSPTSCGILLATGLALGSATAAWSMIPRSARAYEIENRLSTQKVALQQEALQALDNHVNQNAYCPRALELEDDFF